MENWPCGEAEQCSQHRGRGAHCLNPSGSLRTSSASLRDAGPVLNKAEGVGEPRRAPVELAPAEAGGHATAYMVLATFTETTVAWRPGRDQALPHAKITIWFGV